MAAGTVTQYRRLLRYVWPYKWIFLAAIAGMAILSATSAGFAALMKPLVDNGLVARDPATMKYIPPLIVGLFFVRALGNFLSQYGLNWIGRRVTFDLREAMFAQLVHLPSGFFDANSSGGLISKLIFDVEQIAAAVTAAVLTIVRDSLTLIALAAWMLYLNWKLTLLFAVLTPVSSWVLGIMNRRFRKTSVLIQNSMGDISHVLQEAIGGQRIVKAFTAQRFEIETFRRANERNRKETTRRSAISAVGISLLQLVASGALALVIYAAFSFGDVSAGDFASFISAMILMMAPGKNLAKVNELVQTGLAAATSVFGLLDQAREPDAGATRLEHVRGRVEYRNANFRYPLSDAPALHNVSFIIEPGETLALVGASGSGKTTIASLLPRFYRVDDGAIWIDDVDINDCALADLRRHIAVVGQDTMLFDDTIRNNIVYGSREPIDDARVDAAARVAHVLEFARQFPEGLETRVGERGSLLSGGQRQRVAIARA
ncbi:MAG TPA: ABC transporter transmembrane domain-containing protein, partial [Burkholderiales bacterium]|nr:ABC transporter transmembrane domain-containing protein [Burkholderiales bacterium]